MKVKLLFAGQFMKKTKVGKKEKGRNMSVVN